MSPNSLLLALVTNLQVDMDVPVLKNGAYVFSYLATWTDFYPYRIFIFILLKSNFEVRQGHQNS